ncbi:hypothetical protein ACOYW6_09620 [Parablastomonas sp. CN1-191]|uniref:hypothetical protein n=1 Tax=Parablastomonas sp. CN1-191 TaxID=3400908 RepID=UPI003BF845AE
MVCGDRGVAALALIGELADDLRPANAAAIFDVLASQGYSTDVVETCRSAWRSTRNPMALLLPLIWQPWTSGEQHRVQDDEVPPSQMIAGVPSYAVDQFTRSGGQVARAYLRRDYAMRSLLDAAFVPRGQWPRAIGDLIFLNEGSCFIRRAIWPLGEKLRQPQRALLHAIGLGDHLTVALDHLDANRPVIASLRSYHLQLGL